MMLLGFGFTLALGSTALAIFLLKDMFGVPAADVEDPVSRIVRPLRVLAGALVAFVASFSLSLLWSVESYLANLFIQGGAFLAAAWLASRIAKQRAFLAVAIGLSYWVLLATILLLGAEERVLRSVLAVTGYVAMALLAAWRFGRSYEDEPLSGSH
jgi:hypothetical protein